MRQRILVVWTWTGNGGAHLIDFPSFSFAAVGQALRVVVVRRDVIVRCLLRARDFLKQGAHQR